MNPNSYKMEMGEDILGECEVERQTEVSTEMKHLEDLTRAINRKFEMLNSRLRTVTISYPQKEGEEKKAGRSTILGCELQKNNSVLQSILTRLENMIESIEL